jgi:hypothetical protein
MAAPLEQFSGPSEDAKRVTTESDIAVGKQHGLPTAGTGQRLEDVSPENRRPATTRDPDCRRGLVDSKRRDAAPNEFPDQTPWTAAQVDRRTRAQLQYGSVEIAVGMPAAEPSPHREVSDFTIVVADPTALTAQCPVVEIAQHVRVPQP